MDLIIIKAQDLQVFIKQRYLKVYFVRIKDILDMYLITFIEYDLYLLKQISN